MDACSARFSKRRGELVISVPEAQSQAADTCNIASPDSGQELSCPEVAEDAEALPPVELCCTRGIETTKVEKDDYETVRSAVENSNYGTSTVLGAIKQAAALQEKAANGSDIDEQSLNLAGTWMLHSAASIGDAQKVKALLLAGQDANAPDETGVSALEKGCTGAHAEVVAVLLNNGAKVAGIRTSSSTPLHRAVSAGSKARGLVKLLCARGAKCTAKDRAGRTPADLARQMGMEPLPELIAA